VWPNGRVPYQIQSSVDSVTKARVLQAMDEWETKSEKRVRFVKATASDDPVLVIAAGSKPITNFVGYDSSKNSRIELRTPEYITVIRHELGHALGLHHEQRRSDRSDHIQVKTGNIV